MTTHEMSFLSADPTLTIKVVDTIKAGHLRGFGDYDVNLVVIFPTSVAQTPSKTQEQ